MGEGYESAQHAESWQDLDEFLCEYVDGTMDPVVREVFEEYVGENPDLAEHVQCLCEAREVLSHSVCACHLASDFLDRLRRRLLAEQGGRGRSVLPDAVTQLGYLAALTSALVVMTVAAMVVGEFVTEPRRAALADRGPVVSERVEGLRFSNLFVPPADRALLSSASLGMTPVAPKQMPIAPLWADAEWRRGSLPHSRVAAAR